MGTFYNLEIRSQGRRKEVWRLKTIREVREREIQKVKIKVMQIKVFVGLRYSGNFRFYKIHNTKCGKHPSHTYSMIYCI